MGQGINRGGEQRGDGRGKGGEGTGEPEKEIHIYVKKVSAKFWSRFSLYTKHWTSLSRYKIY